MKWLPYILITSVGITVAYLVGRTAAPCRHTESIVTRIDTLRDTIPIPIRDTLIRWQVVAVRDTDTIYVPITQKEYSTPQYHAWISGYESKLDSIHIYNRTQTITVRDKKRWSLGISTGYGATRQGLSPYIGISLTYNLFQW